MRTNNVHGEIIIRVWIGNIILKAMVIACTVKSNVPIIQIAGPLNAEITIAPGGKLENAVPIRSEHYQIIFF